MPTTQNRTSSKSGSNGSKNTREATHRSSTKKDMNMSDKGTQSSGSKSDSHK